MAKLRPLEIIIQATDKASGVFGRLEKRTEGFGRKVGSLGRTLTMGFTLPVTASGVAASKMAVGFDDALTKIVSLVGLSREEVDGFRKGLLALAKETGRGPKELAEGLFFVTSAGFRGQRALDVLRASSQASAAGMGETATVADAATSAINAYGAENLGAADSVGILVAAVREGKAEAGAIAPVLGRVIPIASDLGVGFDQVAASIAAMTRLGTSADESATSLRATLLSLLKPTQQQEKALNHFGLSSAGLREQLREKGLLSVLETLKEKVGDNKAAMAAIFPNVRALTGVLNLVGKNAAQTRGIFDSLATASGEDLVRAFDEALRHGLRLLRGMASLSTVAIHLGNAILPVVVPAFERFAAGVSALGEGFSGLDPKMQRVLVIGTGLAVILPPLLVGLGIAVKLIPLVGAGLAILNTGLAFTGALLGLILSPIGLIIAGVVTLGIVLFKTFKPFHELVLGTWEALSSIGSKVGGFFGVIPGREAAAPAPLAAARATAAGRAAAALGGEQRVGGTIRLEVESDRPVRVRDLAAEGGIDLEVDPGLAMAF
jgi:TP901 family phage tail tape measure protein